MNCQRKAVAALEARAHSFERGGDSAHRAGRQRGIAGEGRDQPVDPGDGADQQSGGGAAIAAIYRLVGRAPFAALHAPFSRSDALDAGAECLDYARRGEHIVAFEQSGDARFARRHRAEDQCAVRAALVAGDRCLAAQGRAGRRDQIHSSNAATCAARSTACAALSRGSHAVSQLRSSSSMEAGPRPPMHSVTSSALISRCRPPG